MRMNEQRTDSFALAQWQNVENGKKNERLKVMTILHSNFDLCAFDTFHFKYFNRLSVFRTVLFIIPSFSFCLFYPNMYARHLKFLEVVWLPLETTRNKSFSLFPCFWMDFLFNVVCHFLVVFWCHFRFCIDKIVHVRILKTLFITPIYRIILRWRQKKWLFEKENENIYWSRE